MKDNELLPCPFCGKGSHIRKDGNGYRVICAKCGTRGPRAAIKEWHDTKFIAQGQAIAAWNTRTPPHTEQEASK